MNNLTNKRVGVTLAAGFQTTDRVDIPSAPTGGTLQKRFVGTRTSTASSDGSTGVTSVANDQNNLPEVKLANAQLQAIAGGAFKVLTFTGSTNGMKTGVPASTTRNKLTLAFVFRMNATPLRDNWDSAFQIFQNQQWTTNSVHIALYNDGGNIKVVIAVNGGGFSGSILGGETNNWTPFNSLAIDRRYTLVVSLDSITKYCIARLNGAEQTINLDSTMSSRNFLSGDSSVILGCTATSTRKFDGNIGEFIMYDNTALTSAQMQQIETYVNSNYVDPASSVPSPSGSSVVRSSVPSPSVSITSPAAAAKTFRRTGYIASGTLNSISIGRFFGSDSLVPNSDIAGNSPINISSQFGTLQNTYITSSVLPGYVAQVNSSSGESTLYVTWYNSSTGVTTNAPTTRTYVTTNLEYGTFS
jgi:hypothetical protein